MLNTDSSHLTALPGHGKGALAYNLAGIALLVLLVAVGAAYVVDALGRNEQPIVPALGDGDAIAQNLGGRELLIPARWFRDGEQVREGFAGQIDLKVMLQPQGAGAPAAVHVTLLPRSKARTSASLLDRVYLHQFGEETLEGVPGLVGKPMLAGNGYEDESVWYDALSSNPFVAKCMSRVDGTGARQCIRTVYLPSGIAAVYTFDAALLAHWRQFDAEMARWLTRIGA